MPNQDARAHRARRASPPQSPSRGESRRDPGPRRAEHVALASRASCGPRKRNRSRRIAMLLLIVLALLAIQPEIPAQADPDPPPGAAHWTRNAPTAHQDPHRSGSVDIPLAGQDVEILWHNTTDDPFLAGAVMDEHRVYTVDRAGVVTARTLATGSAQWTKELGEGVAATPSLASGWLYVATLEGNLWALESQSGTQMAKTELSGAARAPTLVAQGRVFQGTDAGALHVLDSATLTTLWRFDTSTVSYNNGTVDEENAALSAPIRAPPAVHDGRVFVTAWNARAYSMSIHGNEHGHTETLHWTREVGDAVKAAPTVDRHNDHVIIPTKDGRLKAYHPTTGNLVWQSAPASFIAGIAVDGEQIIARTGDSAIFSLNATTGAQQWTVEDPAGHLAAPVLARDAIVQASGNGTLALLSPTTGKPLAHAKTLDGTARWALGGAIHAAPAVTRNGIAVVDHSGTLTLLGKPPDLQSDLEALSIRTIEVPIEPELGLRLGVVNHGPDASPEVHIRIERNGALHKEQILGRLEPGEEHAWDFRFASTPGDHELTVTYRPLGARDPDPGKATIKQTVTLTDLDPANATIAPPEPAGPAPDEATFGDGVATGLAWAMLPGLNLGAAAGILLTRRLTRARTEGRGPGTGAVASG